MDVTVDKTEQAKASTAGARVQLPINMENWRRLDEELQQVLLWFHQHALDTKLTLEECGEALGYDKSTVFRIFKGNYEGSWKNVRSRIESYRQIAERRATIQQNEFCENSISKLIFAGLDYAFANNSITIILGESRTGKSAAAREWTRRNNHGRTIMVEAPVIGGAKGLLLEIARKVGVNGKKPLIDLCAAIHRAFNKNRMLIIDEAHRLLPRDHRGSATLVDLTREIRDKTGCALALISTHRFGVELEKGAYMYEQVLGRVGMPVKVKREIPWTDVEGIVKQYIKRPSKALQATCTEMANNVGRLGILVETLKAASRMATKKNAKLDEEWVYKAIGIRNQMSSGK